jgi:hypothetical protein
VRVCDFRGQASCGLAHCADEINCVAFAFAFACVVRNDACCPGTSRGGILCMVLHQTARIGVAGTAAGALEIFTLDQCRPSVAGVAGIEPLLPEDSTEQVDRSRVSKAHDGAVLCIEADWANGRIVTGSRDGSAKVWRVQPPRFDSCRDTPDVSGQVGTAVWREAPELICLASEFDPHTIPMHGCCVQSHATGMK